MWNEDQELLIILLCAGDEVNFFRFADTVEITAASFHHRQVLVSLPNKNEQGNIGNA